MNVITREHSVKMLATDVFKLVYGDKSYTLEITKNIVIKKYTLILIGDCHKIILQAEDMSDEDHFNAVLVTIGALMCQVKNGT